MSFPATTDSSRRRPTLRVLPKPQDQLAQSTSQVVRRKLLVSQILGLLLLIPALPIIGLLVVLVRLTSPGPGIYRQRRVGYQGREFVMFKIRSMRINAEAESGPVWAKEDDDRATLLGKTLRRVHLDELPQLFNVLRGEMCLVGPRPERPEIVAKLRHQVPGYLDRLEVPPGIAGLAQLRQGADVDLESVLCKQSLDLAYIRCLPTMPLVDFRILFATALLLIGFSRKLSARCSSLDIIQPIAILDAATDVSVNKAA